MSHTDHGQPDLTALHAAAGGAAIQAESGQAGMYGNPLAGGDRVAPLARNLAPLAHRGRPDRTPLRKP
jgi:hypothetical protein